MSVAVSVRKNVLSEQYSSKTDILSGNWKNVKCVSDAQKYKLRKYADYQEMSIVGEYPCPDNGRSLT